MKNPKQELFRRNRQNSVFNIKSHANFLRDKLDALEKSLDENEGGAHFALLTEQLIAASPTIPLIVRELGIIRENYEIYKP